MRKKDLLKCIPDKWPEENMARVIRTPGKRALMIILPNWQVVGHSAEKFIVHFVWSDGYLTYFPISGQWTRQKYDTLYFNSYLSGGGFDDKSSEVIQGFTKSFGTRGAIECYEREIDYRKQEQAIDRKQKRIDDYMKEIPPLPKGFKKWCTDKFHDEKKDKMHVKLFQPYKNGTIERIFLVDWNQWRGDAVLVTEICRALQLEYGGAWKQWFYGEYKGRYGKNQHFWDRKNLSIVHNLPLTHYVYDNLDSLEMTEAQKAVIRALDGRVDPSIALSRLKYRPELEYVVKRGLIRLGEDVVNGRCGNMLLKDLSKETCRRLKECDGGAHAARLLEVAPKIDDKYLKDFCKIKDYGKADSIIGLACEYNINHVYKLLMAAGGATNPNIITYKDYLRMARELGNNPHDEIIYRNKNWMEWHDRYVEELNKKKERKENRKYVAIKKDYQLNKALFAWEDKGYCIIVPKSAAEINEEGRRQHHCVGAQPGYKQRMADREKFIVFLRKADKPKEPYYTIECDLGRVIQFYAAYDRQPDKEEVQKVLAKWMKQVRKNAKKLKQAAV